MDYSIATVTSKMQCTIPKVIRERLGIKPGDKVSLTVEDGAMILTPIGRIVEETAGNLGKNARHHK